MLSEPHRPSTGNRNSNEARASAKAIPTSTYRKTLRSPYVRFGSKADIRLTAQFIINSLRGGIRPTTVITRWKIAALMRCICQHRLNEALFHQGAEKLGG